MNAVDSHLIYKCNGCGYRYKDPQYCHHCGTPECPSCKRAGCITSMVEMHRMVSHSKPLLAGDLHEAMKVSAPKSKQKKKTAKPKKSIAQMMEELGVS